MYGWTHAHSLVLMMAPVWLAGRLRLCVLLLFVLLLASVTKTIDSLLVYDRQELLKIKASVDCLVVPGQDDQRNFVPPLLADIPAYLLHVKDSLPRRRKRHRRRGTRAGRLVRVKAWLAISPESAQFSRSDPPEYGAYRRLSSRRPPALVRTWLLPVVDPYEEFHGLRSVLPRLRRLGGVNHGNLKPLSRAARAANTAASTATRCALLNARSVKKKSFILNDLFSSHALDILFVTETWMKPGESAALTELLPPDCTVINSPRMTGHVPMYFCAILNHQTISKCE